MGGFVRMNSDLQWFLTRQRAEGFCRCDKFAQKDLLGVVLSEWIRTYNCFLPDRWQRVSVGATNSHKKGLAVLLCPNKFEPTIISSRKAIAQTFAGATNSHKKGWLHCYVRMNSNLQLFSSAKPLLRPLQVRQIRTERFARGGFCPNEFGPTIVFFCSGNRFWNLEL